MPKAVTLLTNKEFSQTFSNSGAKVLQLQSKLL
jgi:hypothetical protein